MTQVFKSFADLGTAIKPEKKTEVITTQSASSRIKAWLTGLVINFPEFTTPEISERVGASHGATSGFMAKLKASGVAEVVGKRNGQLVYRIDRQKLSEHHVRVKGAGGSEKGRRCGGPRTSTAGLPDLGADTARTEFDPVEKLNEVIAHLCNKMEKTLADFTTEELVDEVHRRVHAGKG